MKILMIADTEESALWDDWSEETAARLSDTDLILSAGDLDADYLEFLVTMLNVPLVYVRGNHDGDYGRKPPEGCIDADGRVVEAEGLKILGLGGCMRYRENADGMYSEEEMRRRIAGGAERSHRGKDKRQKGYRHTSDPRSVQRFRRHAGSASHWLRMLQ